VGTPSASDLTLAPGAGHGDEGDASYQGPAQERLLPLPEQPKPANPETAVSENASGSVIELAVRIKKPNAADATAATPDTDGLVIVRSKPAKRKNAKERAKEKYAKDRTTPTMTAKAKSKVETKAKKKAGR
jgi:hypothetical protein